MYQVEHCTDEGRLVLQGNTPITSCLVHIQLQYGILYTTTSRPNTNTSSITLYICKFQSFFSFWIACDIPNIEVVDECMATAPPQNVVDECMAAALSAESSSKTRDMNANSYCVVRKRAQTQERRAYYRLQRQPA